MNAQFNLGDVVELNSGSPKMTVTEIKDDELECTWITSDVNKKRDNFIKEAIKKSKSDYQ